MISNESPPLALPSTVSSSELPDVPDTAQHPLIAIRKRMMEGSHKHSNNPGSPNKRRLCPTPVPEHQQQHQYSPVVPLMCHHNDIGRGGHVHVGSPKTPNPTHFMSITRSGSRLQTPRTPGRNHDDLAQDTNWTRAPPTFFRLPHRRVSRVNLAEIIEAAVEKDLLRMDLEEGKITGADDASSWAGVRMQPRFHHKELAEILAQLSQDRSHPTGMPPPPPLPAPPLYQQELKQAEVEQDDEQKAKEGAQEQQQEKQHDAATGDEGSSSSLPTGELAAMSLATAHRGAKLSEASPKVVREQRPSRPGRRLSAPSA